MTSSWIIHLGPKFNECQEPESRQGEEEATYGWKRRLQLRNAKGHKRLEGARILP